MFLIIFKWIQKGKNIPHVNLPLFWLWMLTAQLLLGAVAAANFRTANDAIFGSEFVNGAAWGSGQLFLRANLSKSVSSSLSSCWNNNNKYNNHHPPPNSGNQTVAPPVIIIITIPAI